MRPTEAINSARRYPVGAEVVGNGVSFRVWAPSKKSMAVVLDDSREIEAHADLDGYFSLYMDGLKAGALYQLRLQDSKELLADPASRFQPRGPRGPSMVVDPFAYHWHDAGWSGVQRRGQVLYEMHVGTFTAEGTWRAAMERLPQLGELGITCLEMMPVNEFDGTFGWGYDGTLLYAPTRLYGCPDDLRAFVDEAHRLGIGVILDVVYNHFGAGERFADFTPDYFTDRYANEWGKSINFDGPNSPGVRDYVAGNAAYWIDEFHFDGLRIDATQALFDATKEEHIVARIARACREAAGKRHVLLVSENEPQEARMVRPPEHYGYGLDALWNDDFHHSATVALTGRNQAYYHDHRGTAQEFVSAAKFGFLFQGQRYDWQDGPRGTAGLDLKPCNFVHFLQNHDQIANSGTGQRVHQMTSPARMRAMTALLLLGPQTPMLFQGQEFAASSHFHYFADRGGNDADEVRAGRREFVSQFPNLTDPQLLRQVADPCDRATFEAVKLDWSEWDRNAHVVALHRDLLSLRRTTAALAAQPSARDGRLDGNVMSSLAFLLRFFADRPENERLLLCNLGPDLEVESLADPLFAPPPGLQWSIVWSSEDPAYGGTGRRPVDVRKRWAISGESAVVMAPLPLDELEKPSSEAMHLWQQAISNI